MRQKKWYKEWFVVVFTLFVLFITSYVPMLSNLPKAKTLDRFYYLGEEFPIDMTGNLATVREGYLGHWLRSAKSTSMIPSPGFFLKFEYIFIGQMARVFHVDPLLMFHLTRGLLTIVSVVLLYRLVQQVFEKHFSAVIAFMLAIFGTGILFADRSVMLFDTLVFQRLTFSAHHYLLGGICCMATIWFLAKSFEKPERMNYFLSAVLCGLLTGLTYAPNVIFIVISLFCTYLFMSKSFQRFSMILVFVIIVSLPLLYLRYLSNTTWDFILHPVLEELNPFSLTIFQYLGVHGIVYILAIMSFPFVMKSNHIFFRLLYPWVLLHPVIEFIMSEYIGLNRVRVFLTPYFIVWGILSGITILHLSQLLSKKSNGRFSVKVVSCVFVVILGVASMKTYYHSFFANFRCFCLPSTFDYAYPKKELMNTIEYLRMYTHEEDIVLSGGYSGVLIPAFAGNRVYSSWWLWIAKLELSMENWNNTQQFYQETLSLVEAQDFVRINNIEYVLFGEEEQILRGNKTTMSYPILQEIYKSGSTVLYKVRSF